MCNKYILYVHTFNHFQLLQQIYLTHFTFILNILLSYHQSTHTCILDQWTWDVICTFFTVTVVLYIKKVTFFTNQSGSKS